MTDILELSRLLSSGSITREEFDACLLVVRKSAVHPSSTSPPSLSLSPPTPPPLPRADHQHAEKRNSHDVERKLPPPSITVSTTPQPTAFQQSTLWQFGSRVKRKLPDGSVVTVTDAAGMPRGQQGHGTSSAAAASFQCHSCLRSFANQGGLAIHVRFTHPSDVAARNKQRIAVSSSTTSSSSSTPTTTTSTSSRSTTITIGDDDDQEDPQQPPKKKSHRRGSNRRRRYTFKTKWVREDRWRGCSLLSLSLSS